MPVQAATKSDALTTFGPPNPLRYLGACAVLNRRVITFTFPMLVLQLADIIGRLADILGVGGPYRPRFQKSGRLYPQPALTIL